MRMSADDEELKHSSDAIQYCRKYHDGLRFVMFCFGSMASDLTDIHQV